MGWFRISIAGVTILVLATAVGLAALRFATPMWAGAMLLLTLGVLTLAILGIAYRRGMRRAFWLGFVLLGWGYMILASGSWCDRSADRLERLTTVRPELLTTTALDRLYARYYDDLRGRARGGRGGYVDLRGRARGRPGGFGGGGYITGAREVKAALEQPISMPFPRETPLEDIIKYIKSATVSDQLPNGISFYVDPKALVEAEKTMESPVWLNLEGVPLRTTLELLPNQLDLSYRVEEGFVGIVAKPAGIPASDAEAFRRIGHCLLALVAACMGGIAGRLFYATRNETPDLGQDRGDRSQAHPRGPVVDS